jgi:hypothetical protein
MNATHADWPRRLSDYHSGGVSDAERAAVEDHLRTCAECQEALAMYRRFYALLRSPLVLGAPSARFDEHTVPLATSPRREAHALRPGGSGPNRRRIAGGAAVVAAAVVIAGFVAIIGPRLRAPTASVTPSPRATMTAEPTVQVTATSTAQPQTTATPSPSAFVCANPAGSNMVYAYQRGDSNLYIVTGCSAPRQLSTSYALPLAWSPGSRYLAAMSNDFPSPDRVQIIDTRSGVTWKTSFVNDFGSDDGVGHTFGVFIGWIDDATILVGETTIVNYPAQGEAPGPTTLKAVNVVSHSARALGSIKDWANYGGNGPGVPMRIVAGGRYLFYAAGDGSNATGYLHRFDLTTGADTRLVSLGLFANGGCQVTPVCMWTASWDVSLDGAHILYHHPGANIPPSDTGGPHDTPVYEANPDGSNASQPFGSQLALGLVVVYFSPDGQRAITTDSAYRANAAAPEMKVVTIGKTPKVVGGRFSAWRGDSAAFVMYIDASGALLYDMSSGQITPLENNSGAYLWGN